MTSKEIIHVSEILYELGVPVNLKGFNYLREAIVQALNKPEIIDAMTGRLYPEIARKCHSTPSRVERDMRHAISTSWSKRQDITAWERYFSEIYLKQRPTNTQFIITICNLVRFKLYDRVRDNQQ